MVMAGQQKIHFTLPEEAFGNNDKIMVTGASLEPGMMGSVE